MRSKRVHACESSSRKAWTEGEEAARLQKTPTK